VQAKLQKLSGSVPSFIAANKIDESSIVVDVIHETQ